jgi:hypothetical protein
MTRANGAWVGDEPAQTDVTALVRAVMTLADEAGPEAEAAATCALGNALVFQVQDYLARTSTPDDVELFFEVHGRPPAGVTSWPLAILLDLRRHGVDATGAAPLVERAVPRAAEFVRERSTLAWQS